MSRSHLSVLHSAAIALLLVLPLLGGCATSATVERRHAVVSASPPAASADAAGVAPDGAPDGASDSAQDEEAGMLGAVGGFVDRAHVGASEQFGGFMYQLDDFFAGESESDEPNTSYLRLRIDAAKPALDGFKLDPSLKLRVVLPRSEQRFRLLFSTDDDSGDGRSQELTRLNALDRDEGNASLALRFVRRARTSGQLDFDIGARQRKGSLQLYGRINAGYREALGKRLSLRVDNRYYYYSSSGFENTLRLDLTRALGASEGRFLRASTTFDWRKGLRGATVGQTVGVYADLDSRSALAFEGIGVYDTALNGERRDRYRGHELRLRYRRNIWRPWLFYEAWPAVAWPAERGYRRVWNGLLRLEITIGGAPLAQPEADSGTDGNRPQDAVRADTAGDTQ